MFDKNDHPVSSFGIATVGAIVAGLSHWWLVPLIGDSPPMRVMLVGVVTASAWLGGGGPGLYATVLGFVAIIAANDAPGDWVTLGSRLYRFGLLALLITFLFERLHASRRRAEAKEDEYRRSEGRFRRLVETANEGIWAIDEAELVTYANPRLSEMLGMAPARIIGRPLGQFLISTAEDSTDRSHHDDGPSVWREAQLRGEHGVVRQAMVTSRSIGPDEVPGDDQNRLHGAPGGALFMATDITPLKRAEEALRTERDFTSAVLETAGSLVVVLDPEGRVVRFNRACRETTGYSTEEVLGRPFWDLFLSRDEVGVVRSVFESLLTGTGPLRFENHWRTKTGELRRIAWLNSTLAGPSGHVSFVIGSGIDVTDLRHAEADLRVAKEAAEQASRSKDRFLAVLSHELRTPLTPVLIAVGSMLEADLGPEYRQAHEMIRRNIELEARLIDDLLDLSRVTSGRLRLDLENVDVHETIRRALEICGDAISVTGLEVVTDLRAQHYHVKADHARVMQIAWNLIRNAAKFTQAAGRLSIRTANPVGPAGPSGEGISPQLVVEFEDTGIGMDNEILPRIFDPFEQGDAGLRGRRGGLGLGLAISRSLAEAMGGRLTATSPGCGQGSTFRLELTTTAIGTTLDGDKTGAKPSESPSVTQESPKLHILLVEDNLDTLRFLAMVLRQRGHQVVTADHFASAQAALRGTDMPFDLLLSDIELPDGNGLDLMRELAACGGAPGIAMSGFGSDEDSRLSRDAGFIAHLTKPIDLSQLDHAIKCSISSPKVREMHELSLRR